MAERGKKTYQVGNSLGGDRLSSKEFNKHHLAGVKVRIVDYDPSRHLVRAVMMDGSPLAPDSPVDEKLHLEKKFEKHPSKSLKYSDDLNAPILEVTAELASMRGNKNYGFYTFKEGGGNIIKGPLSIATDPHQVRIAGLNTLNPLIISGFPSTIITPIPTTLFSIPGTGAIGSLMKNTIILGTLVAAMGALG
jgi:hypothetical protein